MLKGGKPRLQIEPRQRDQVSSAFWPVYMRKGMARNKVAQSRRDWLLQGRWKVLLIAAYSLRVLQMVTTLLIISTSLLVATLGLHYWYILLLPLFFTILRFVGPLLLARYVARKIVPLSPFTQIMRSSAGYLTQHPYEWKSAPGMLSLSTHELRSSGGIRSQLVHELSSEVGRFTDETPTTPRAVDAPLVRVLETYDLRTTPAQQFPNDLDEQEMSHILTPDF